jgi:hypothetical protein
MYNNHAVFQALDDPVDAQPRLANALLRIDRERSDNRRHDLRSMPRLQRPSISKVRESHSLTLKRMQ